MDYIHDIAIAVVSSVFGGCVTYMFERRKERRKEKNETYARLEEERKNRPEFIIANSKDLLDLPGSIRSNNSCDIGVFLTGFESVNIDDDLVSVQFEDSTFDKENWVCKEYTLRNIGKTVVYEVDIISNFQKSTCLYNAESSGESIIHHGFINYSELLDKRIGPDESFTLRIYYRKEKIIGGMFSAILSIGMRDDNDSYWIQPFFAPVDKLYESRKVTHREYHSLSCADDAIECFKKPYLW